MLDKYTVDINESFVSDLLERDAAHIWEDLFPAPQDADIDLWKRKLGSISHDYRLSIRFALMRIFQSRAAEAPQHSPAASEDAFTVKVGDSWICFSGITMEHAKTLSPEENENYIAYLLEVANTSQDADPAFNKELISQAWYDVESANQVSEIHLLKDNKDPQKYRKSYEKENKKRFGSRLTREAALQLGHILQFSLFEMQWFLLRAFDTNSSFRMNRSEDLIESYCFYMNASWQKAEQLKKEYAQISAGIEKIDNAERGRNWTANVSHEFSEHLERWKRHPETRDAQFLSWLKDHACGLDLPSHTARKVYRNLAVYAYKLAAVDESKCISGKSLIPEESDFLDDIQKICSLEDENPEVRFYLYQDGKISEDRCGAFAKALLRDNSEISASANPDNAKGWATLTTRPDGTLSSTYGVINESRTRVKELLMGTAEVEKGDLLYLLWFVLNLIWYESKNPDSNTLCCRIFDLKDAAYLLLDSAGLPMFYPPHLVEQSMLLSVIYGGKNHINPIEVYGQLLQYVKKPRNRKPQSK